MDSFTLVDGIVAVVIVMSALLAYARGFVREALAIVGWIAAAMVAFVFAESAMPLVKQIPVLGDRLAESCEMAIILSFAAVFAVALVVASLFTPLFSSVVQRSILGGADQALGFFFGVLRGIVLVAVAFFAYNTVLEARNIAMIDDSRAAAVFGDLGKSMEDRDPEEALDWLTQQYERLVGVCAQ